MPESEVIDRRFLMLAEARKLVGPMQGDEPGRRVVSPGGLLQPIGEQLSAAPARRFFVFGVYGSLDACLSIVPQHAA